MSSGRIAARVASIAPSATLAVTNKANQLRAAGEPVIGFGAGEPDFPTPDYIVEAAVAACRDPKNHRYSPAGGLPDLKAAIAEKTRRDSGYDVEPSQVVITAVTAMVRGLKWGVSFRVGSCNMSFSNSDFFLFRLRIDKLLDSENG